MTERFTLFFEPLDVLQFRNHRPADAGYHTLAESRFPLPSVFLGCIRTALFRRLGADFSAGENFAIAAEWARQLLGTASGPGTLCPRGPLVARRAPQARALAPAAEVITPYFPPPLDLVPLAANPNRQASDYAILRPKDIASTLATRIRSGPDQAIALASALPWTPHQAAKRAPARLLTTAGARAYLDAAQRGADSLRLDATDVVDPAALFQHETRVGLVRNRDVRTAEDHMLYIQRPFRLATSHGFAVDVAVADNNARDCIQALDGAALPLGGKGRRARVRVHPGGLVPNALEPAATPPGTGCALWFLSPMPVSSNLNGWPQGMSGVTDRAVALGGFDLKTRRPKPLQPALPAGTVVYARGVTPDQAQNALIAPDLALNHIRRLGLGLAVERSL